MPTIDTASLSQLTGPAAGSEHRHAQVIAVCSKIMPANTAADARGECFDRSFFGGNDKSEKADLSARWQSLVPAALGGPQQALGKTRLASEKVADTVDGDHVRADADDHSERE